MLEEIPAQEILRAALKGGGDFADLFFEESRSIVIVCEEDRIEKVVSGVDIGVGLRILFDMRTLYAFTNQISRDDLCRLAERVSRAVREERRRSLMDISRHRPPVSSPGASQVSFLIEKHPEDVPIGEKISVVKRANDIARRLDLKKQRTLERRRRFDSFELVVTMVRCRRCLVLLVYRFTFCYDHCRHSAAGNQGSDNLPVPYLKDRKQPSRVPSTSRENNDGT